MTVLLISACGADSPEPSSTETGPGTPSGSESEAGSHLPQIEVPVEADATVEGLIDVNGHAIYARCSGTGTGNPTVVYFAGWAPDQSKLGVDTIRAVEAADDGRHRICSYERRNTGRSETVDGTQSPEEIVADADGVLEAIGEDGPFVLLGASFGGPVAGAYAVAHPDRVTAILLLDSSIPDDYIIDRRHGFAGMCLRANREADARDSLEKIDNCQLAQWAYDRRAEEPEVPLIYTAAADPSDRGDVTDDSLRKAFVRRWSPGIWKPVSAPHWMDEAEPNLVVRNLEHVIAPGGLKAPLLRRGAIGLILKSGHAGCNSTRWSVLTRTPFIRPIRYTHAPVAAI
ncbi:alpha/beta fold hydrolase [Nocardioides sp. B-3]|uniref:alpha/beta fold hydrolase n=1 Tax=Nocardioides sp. B-3 TaxID=2895565 RepID=UPI0021524C4F|nr:alpha/beta hydrolase [Nocardioides sp. B-3]UUZ58289.1 alpha/beta hydrolase [Nocardioides sp. B-3]